jgi:hypothetical protein
MRFTSIVIVLALHGYVTPVPLVGASVYDSNVVQHLQLTGIQKLQMEKLVRESRARRNRIFRKHGIDPNAKPSMWLLMRASSELKANLARERAAAKRILTPQQMQLYDTVIKRTRRRIMSSF